MGPFRVATGLAIVVVTFLSSPSLAETSGRIALSQLSGEIIGQDGTPMALVTAGKFTFGDSSYNHQERRIYLDSFYMDKFEVTLARYAKFLRVTSQEYPSTLTTTDCRFMEIDPWSMWIGMMPRHTVSGQESTCLMKLNGKKPRVELMGARIHGEMTPRRPR